MRGAPHRQARSSARSFFVLPLVLALLALVAFPVFAHAGGIPQYEVSESETGITREPVHKTKSNESQSTEKGNQAKAEGSDTGEEMTGSENGSNSHQPSSLLYCRIDHAMGPLRTKGYITLP